ncbi:hypothetical protein [Methanoregula sp.]|uniref:hypothetical protein n=1 Tax=Methanoregula sp. TaxID=2052170 RepID=UPI002BE30933|nr:hypothetical protein [Methanoregula sp.]HVP96764.1 hypothetical protein [Methanoregula sp.]
MNLRAFFVAALIVVVLLSAVAGPVSGTVYPVDNSYTLSAFQNFLNTTSDGDTITFAKGTYYYTDVLVLANNLTFQSNQSIGATTQNTIIDGINNAGNPSEGIFYNTSSTGAQITNITIKDLTFRNGYSGNADGGGAIHTYANTTVISSDFINDTAPGKNGGGAISIHTYGLLMTVTGSNFTWCSALDGGALYMSSAGTIMVNSSSFVNCYGTGNGGAVSANTQINATFCRFGNTSSGAGDILHTVAGDIYAPDNWWGTNAPTASMATAGGHLYQDPYLVLGVTAAPVGITTAQTSAIQANLSYDSTGTIAANNILPDGIPVIFTIVSGPAGSVLSAGQVLTTGHAATSTFSSPAAGTAQVNASVDGFNVSVNVSVTAASSGGGGGGSRTDYWVKSGTNDVGYEGTQPTPLGFGPSPTKTIPPTPVTPAMTPVVIPPHPVPVPAPSIADQIIAAIQAYFAWLVLIVILIVIAVLLRRWWIRRQNPGLFGK